MASYHQHAAILSIGDELSLGQSLDTNSRWVADRLTNLGVTTIEHVTIGDDEALTADTFRRLASRADLIVSTGGLGPTLDDLTRQALANVLDESLITDADALATLIARFTARGRVMSDLQRLQALRPPSARMLPNPNGTAPGLHAVVKIPADSSSASSGESSNRGESSPRSVDVFCLPGPPGEMKPMFEAQVTPAIRLEPGRRVITHFIHLAGIGEGDAATKLGTLMDRARVPLVGITASGGVLTCRVRYDGVLDEAEVKRLIDDTDQLIRQALGVNVFGQGTDTVVSSVLNEMASRGETLACVESCTGGALGQMISDVPGSSSVFIGGLVTYSNELKTALAEVPAELLAALGAVSEPVARAMASGGLRRTGASRCLSITGIAGPAGGTTAKPVGTVYIGMASANRNGGEPAVEVRRFAFTGSRADIRQRAAMTAMGMLLFSLRGSLSQMKLLWEVA